MLVLFVFSECLFSVMCCIKNYLRVMMGDERLLNFFMMYIYRLRYVVILIIIDRFVVNKNRCIDFL